MDINGHESALDDIKTAQHRLATACLQQPMNPSGATISAFVNAMLNGATISALVEYVTMPAEFDMTQTPPLLIDKPAWESVWLKHLNAKAEVFEKAAANAPRIMPASSLAGAH